MSDQESGPPLLHAAQDRGRGFSLRARLALGFLLVALLFLAVDYLGQRNTTLITKRIDESTLTNREFDRVARTLTDALSDYQRLLLRIDNQSGKSEFARSQHAVDTTIEKALKDYQSLGNPFGDDGLPPQELSRSVQELQAAARALLSDARRLDEPLNRYWTNLDRLQKELGAAATADWRIGDRVVVRRSTTVTVEALQEVRRVVSAYLASPNPQRAADVASKEREFVSTLDNNAPSWCGGNSLAGMATL